MLQTKTEKYLTISTLVFMTDSFIAYSCHLYIYIYIIVYIYWLFMIVMVVNFYKIWRQIMFVATLFFVKKENLNLNHAACVLIYIYIFSIIPQISKLQKHAVIKLLRKFYICSFRNGLPATVLLGFPWGWWSWGVPPCLPAENLLIPPTWKNLAQ